MFALLRELFTVFPLCDCTALAGFLMIFLSVFYSSCAIVSGACIGVSFDGHRSEKSSFRAESLLILVHLSNYACICNSLFFLSGLKLGSEAKVRVFLVYVHCV